MPERRAEGTACIERERALTDFPFPANSTRKQAALLLCDVVARRAAIEHEVIGARQHGHLEPNLRNAQDRERGWRRSRE